MSQDLSALQSAVAANTSVINSAVTLIQGFSARLQEAIDNGADPADLQRMVDELNAQDAALAAAVAANTPAEQTVPGGDATEPVAENPTQEQPAS